jgi:hypothetical protein
MESRYLALTTEIDLGRIVSHTRPDNILVTANPSVNKSALDCELPNICLLSSIYLIIMIRKHKLVIKHYKSQHNTAARNFTCWHQQRELCL